MGAVDDRPTGLHQQKCPTTPLTRAETPNFHAKKSRTRNTYTDRNPAQPARIHWKHTCRGPSRNSRLAAVATASRQNQPAIPRCHLSQTTAVRQEPRPTTNKFHQHPASLYDRLRNPSHQCSLFCQTKKTKHWGLHLALSRYGGGSKEDHDNHRCQCLE